tara:strand:- start:356 stop:1240 length:885 start_codon:yes stop_codon:yes gene_type:complete
MATVNLGRIKPVFKGTWSNSTAYTVDDFVVHSNECYIAIQAGTNQNPASASSYWTKIAAKGTDGTDISTTLTTQGDILFRDGSGLQRLAKGTAAQVLKMNTAANAPEWGNLSSDYVKIARYSATGVGASSYNFENIFDASVYSRYIIHGYINKSSNGSQIRARYLNGSTAYTNTNGYFHGGYDAYRQTNNNGNTLGPSNDGDGRDYLQMIAWGSNSTYGVAWDMTIEASQLVAGEHKFSTANSRGRDDSGTSYVYSTGYGHHTSFTGLVNGIQFYTGDGNGLGQINITIYGEKI